MTARGPRRQERTAGQPTTGRHGTLSVQMTANELLSLAVNVAQNGWPIDAAACTATGRPDAMRIMLDELFGEILAANHRAIKAFPATSSTWEDAYNLSGAGTTVRSERTTDEASLSVKGVGQR